MKRLDFIIIFYLIFFCGCEFEDDRLLDNTITYEKELVNPSSYDYWMMAGLPMDDSFQKLLTVQNPSSAPWKDPYPMHPCFNHNAEVFIGYAKHDQSVKVHCGKKGDFSLIMFWGDRLRDAGVVFVWRSDLNLWISTDCRAGAISPGKRPRYLTESQGYPSKYPLATQGLARCWHH